MSYPINKTKIVFLSGALGDTIGWMGQVERYQKHTGETINVFCNHRDFFKAQNISYYYRDHPLEKEEYNKAFYIGFYDYNRTYHGSLPDDCSNEITPIMQNGLIGMASDILGFDKIKEVKPSFNLDESLTPELKELKDQGIKKFVTLATLSTLQQKFWNYKGGWREIISYLKSKGVAVVSVDLDVQFGSGVAKHGFPAFSSIPLRSIDMTGLSLGRVASLINGGLFHMGLSSGISWLAWAVNKPVVLICGHVNERYDFSNPYRIQNKSVCHACWDRHKTTTEALGDWYWCPDKKDFECTREITPDMVIEKIDQLV